MDGCVFLRGPGAQGTLEVLRMYCSGLGARGGCGFCTETLGLGCQQSVQRMAGCSYFVLQIRSAGVILRIRYIAGVSCSQRDSSVSSWHPAVSSCRAELLCPAGSCKELLRLDLRLVRKGVEGISAWHPTSSQAIPHFKQVREPGPRCRDVLLHSSGRLMSVKCRSLTTRSTSLYPTTSTKKSSRCPWLI